MTPVSRGTTTAEAARMLRTRHLGAPLLLLAGACTTTTETEAPSATDETPRWVDAPATALTIGEGQTITVPLTLEDPDGGDVSAVVSAPPGMDAEVRDGQLHVHAGYGVASAPLSVVITDDEGTASDVPVSVEVAPIGWVDYQSWTTAEGPEEREHATVLFHEASKSAFMFGGSGYHPQFSQMMDDFWRYDTVSGTWTAITPTGDVPPAAGSRRFAGVWGSGEGLVFGGYGAGNVNYSDLYRVKVEGDTLAFELVEANGEVPFARSLHGFVYDPVIDRYFAFGGVSSFIYGDTWMLEVDGATAQWTQLEFAVAPSRRYGFFYGFDEAAGRMILYSGAQGTASVDPASDTWALDVRSDPPQWVFLADAATSPPGRRNGCAIWDPSGPRLIVFGGTPDAMNTAPGLFAFDARPGHEAWATLALANEPSLRSSGFGFSDGSRVFLGFGNDNAVYRDWGILGY